MLITMILKDESVLLLGGEGSAQQCRYKLLQDQLYGGGSILRWLDVYMKRCH